MKSDRPKQEVAPELQERLLNYIRHQFCGDVDDKKWFSLRRWFLVYVILWPARFMVRKGFTIPAARYEAIMLEVFGDIKRHGQTASVRHWNGYLLKCVQDHFKHHWEDYYQESKSAANIATNALFALKQVPEVDRTIEHLAAAQAVLAKRTRPKKVKSPKQIDLL